MKSLKLLPLLLLPFAAYAGPEFAVSVSGGAMVTDDLEVLAPGWTVIPRFGVRFNETLELEAGIGYVQGRTRIGGLDADGAQQADFPYTALTPRLDLVGHLWARGKRQEDGSYGKPPWIHPTLAAGVGFWYKNTNDGGALGDLYNRKDVDLLLNAGPGLQVPLGPAVLRTDLRWVLSLGAENFQNRGDQFLNWEWTAGVGFVFGGTKDKDKDGIPDKDDQCPDQPEDRDGFQDDDGCPDLDNDGDGIPDADDQCPDEAEDMDGFEDEDGCPDLDNDGDGILDADDQCPEVPGHASAAGCPDQDGDTLVDEQDECPDEAGPLTAFGCPDDDEDRVPNYRDACPDEPGPKAADPRRSDGCPSQVFVTESAITITDKIFFDTGKATIKKQSNGLLDTIAATLQKYPGIKKVSIEGHTDNVGRPESNQTLSENRAKSVLDYLVAKGVEAERLDSKGFGQTKPLVDGDLANKEEGRSQNRRVEFNILEQEREKVALRRPVVNLFTPESLVQVDGLTPTATPLPEAGTVEGTETCKAALTIGADGKVSRVRLTECSMLARNAAGKALRAWTFEPHQVKGEATAITTQLTMAFKDGVITVTHDKKAIKPVK